MTSKNSETAFWEGMLAQLAPGWAVHFAQHERQPTPEISDMACHVYALV